MPGMSGPDLFEHLKQRQESGPVIFITAQSNVDLCQKLIAQGAVACLYKPFDPLALVAALKSALAPN
jgi:FixJ family two-component response regulator